MRKILRDTIPTFVYMTQINPIPKIGFLFFLMSVLAPTTMARHVMGAEITYRNIDTLTFELKVTYYRDCSGVSMSNPSSATRVFCPSKGLSEGVSLKLKSISQVKVACDALGAQCDSVNKFASGSGIEQFVFLDTIDFRTSLYDTFVTAGCTDIYFETGQCCRNSSITTGTANQNFYTNAYLNLKKAKSNSSPVFTMPINVKMCCMQPYYYNFGGRDTVDYDSISYQFGHPLKAYGSAVSYSGRYAYNRPIDTYYPGSLKFPYTNPGSNPPIGLYLDGETGDFIFTPIGCNEITTVVIEVKEWRKDTSGKQVHIGTIRRDIMFSTEICSDNNPPILKGQFSSGVCEGEEICFTITTEDKVKKPPPPMPAPDPDTTYISWDEGIPWATFKVKSDTVLNQSAEFCWTPKIGQASDIPYMFTASVTDEHCPKPAITSRAFSVRVYPKSDGKVVLDTLSCNQIEVHSIPVVKKVPNVRYRWEVLDSNGRYVSDPRKAPYFSSTKSIVSTLPIDTLNFVDNGTYIIRHILDNQYNCEKVFYDTIEVSNIFKVRLAAETDTFVCSGSTMELTPKFANVTGKVQYLWSDSSTGNTLRIKLADTTDWDSVSVMVEDANGCKAFDQIDILKRPNPVLDKLTDRRACYEEKVTFEAKAQPAFWDDPRDTAKTVYGQGKLDVYWQLPDTTIWNNAKLTVSEEGFYMAIAQDSLGCSDSQAVELVYNDKIAVSLIDKVEHCTNDTLVLMANGLDTSGNGNTGVYHWWNVMDNKNPVHLGSGDSLAYSLVTNTTKHVLVKLEVRQTQDTLTCVAFDSIKITTNPLPYVQLRDVNYCHTKDTIFLEDDKVLIRPGGGTLALGRQTWNCVDCGSYNWKDILHDLGTGGAGAPQDFILRVDNSTMPLNGKGADSIVVELDFTDVYGCRNRDTAVVRIHGAASLSYDSIPDLCHSQGAVQLGKLSKMTPSGGIWKAIDAPGYEAGSKINSVLSGDTLVPSLTPDPGLNKSYVYRLRYEKYDTTGCSSIKDFDLTIRGKTDVKINKMPFSIYVSSEPFLICELDGDITLGANVSGGQWSTIDTSYISGSTFVIGNVKKYNTPFYIYYDLSGGGACFNKDSIQVQVDQRQTISLTPEDTAITWYDQNMSLQVKGSYTNSTGMTWIPLNGGGTVDNNRKTTTLFRFSAEQDSFTRLLLYALTDEGGGGSVCPFTEATMVVDVHPTPCTEIVVDVNITKKELKLSAKNDKLSSFIWGVDGQTSTSATPTFDVSGSKDSLVLIKLTAFNALGDSCDLSKVVNILNGSIDDLEKELKIFPNPVLDGFTIAFDGYIKDDLMQVFDASGAEVMNRKLDGNWVDCQALSEGVYSLVIHHDRRTYIGRFVKR